MGRLSARNECHYSKSSRPSQSRFLMMIMERLAPEERQEEKEKRLEI